VWKWKTAAVSTFGLNAVGIDLNDGLGKANLNKSKYTNGNAVNVEYVQGNLFHPPFKERSFDLIYSSGVIHHTAESKATFQKLVPLVKEGGRLYVWVYSRRTAMVRAFFDAGRELKRVFVTGGIVDVLPRVCSILQAWHRACGCIGHCGISQAKS